MATDLTQLPPEVVEQIRHYENTLLRLIHLGMQHTIQEHDGTPVIMGSEDICPDAVVIVAGANALKRMQALQEMARELHATALADVALKKAASKA